MKSIYANEIITVQIKKSKKIAVEITKILGMDESKLRKKRSIY